MLARATWRADATRLMWVLIGVGLVARTILAFKTYGIAYDIHSQGAVRGALSHDPLHVYALVNGHPFNQWPYLPGFFPWIVVAGKLSSVTGLDFHGFVQLPEIVADGAIAWLVQDHLARRGASDRVRLAAVALVALGPSFWMISGFHGQIDSAAILPAAAALWLWERSAAGTRRALLAGLLIGVGISIKTVPGLMLFALLPSVRSRREAAALIAPAVAVPLAAFLPFLVADPQPAIDALTSHRALPGFGGIGLVAQPELAGVWLNGDVVARSSAVMWVFRHELAIVICLMAPFVALVAWRRPEPTTASAILWIALLVFTPGFSFQYVVWALPFALMAGHLWQVGAAQLALFPAAALLYWHPFGNVPTAVYVVEMLAVWALGVLALLALSYPLAVLRQSANR